MAYRTASDVKLIGPLKDSYRGYANDAQNSLSSALGMIGNQAKTSAIASGRTQGSYQPFALNQAGTIASRGINDTLGAQLGQASLEDMIKQQEFERNMELARKTGGLNSPNGLQMALGAALGAANLYGKYKGFRGPQTSFMSSGNSGMMENPMLNLYQRGNF